MDHFTARAYLSPGPDSFWRWSDDGEAIEWTDGRTLAFRNELRSILLAFSEKGLPPLQGVLLVIAACSGVVRRFEEVFPDELEQAVGVRRRETWGNAFDALTRISTLDAKHRSRLDARIRIAQIVCENRRSLTTVSVAEEVCRLLSGTSVELFSMWSSANSTMPASGFELQWLIAGVNRVDFDQFELVVRTGLDTLPDAATVDAPTTIRELITMLAEDDELDGLARLTRYLMAGVSIPRKLDQADEIAVGGVSDISNRGPLDRLLLSELANEDDLLMTRVALNEALYLRRESPQAAPPMVRRIILDSGLRCWGLPKLFGTAAALALAATSDANTHVEFYRVTESALVPISIKSREQLIQQLEFLATDIHPGKAIETLEQLSDADKVESISILITVPEVADDRNFVQCLQRVDSSIYVATTSRDGLFRLVQRTTHGVKEISRQQLALDEILNRKSQSNQLPVQDQACDQQLPAIFSHEFPFRLIPKFDRRRSWDSIPIAGGSNAEGHQAVVFHANQDGRLLMWDKFGVPPRQLSDKLPRGEVLYRRQNQTGWSRIIIKNHDGTFFVRTRAPWINTVWVSRLDIEFTKIDSVCEHSNMLFVVQQRNVHVFDADGVLKQTLVLPRGLEKRKQFDRFFVGERRVHALSYTGHTAVLEQVAENIDAMGAFDCRHHDSPVILTSGGGFVLPDGTNLFSLSNFKGVPPPPVYLVDTSSDGNVVVVERNPKQTGQRARSSERAILAVENQRPVDEHFYYSCFGILGPRDTPKFAIHSMSTVKRIKSVSIVQGNGNKTTGIYIQRKHRWLAHGIFVAADRSKVMRTHVGDSSLVKSSNQRTLRELGFSIHVSEFENKTICFDSRGVIHFRRQGMPEFSIIISHDDRIAYWTSDAKVGGHPDYLVPRSTLPDAEQDSEFWSLFRQFLT